MLASQSCASCCPLVPWVPILSVFLRDGLRPLSIEALKPGISSPTVSSRPRNPYPGQESGALHIMHNPGLKRRKPGFHGHGCNLNPTRITVSSLDLWRRGHPTQYLELPASVNRSTYNGNPVSNVNASVDNGLSATLASLLLGLDSESTCRQSLTWILGWC